MENKMKNFKIDYLQEIKERNNNKKSQEIGDCDNIIEEYSPHSLEYKLMKQKEREEEESKALAAANMRVSAQVAAYNK